MYYVFKVKQDNNYTHKGKIPTNYINPVNMFISDQIDNKVTNDVIRKDLKEIIELFFFFSRCYLIKGSFYYDKEIYVI